MKSYLIDYKNLKTKIITREAAIIEAYNIKAALLEAVEKEPAGLSVCGIKEKF